MAAVYIMIEPADSEKVRQKWETWGQGVRLVMLDLPYRLLLETLLTCITDITQKRQPGETITIVVPEFVSNNRITGIRTLPIFSVANLNASMEL